MLGSAFDGERANATNILQRMAEARKVTLTELIEQAYSSGGSSQQRKPPPPPPPPQDDFEDVDKADDLLRMLQQIADNPAIAARVLTPWEINFATDVAGRYSHDYDLSEKQLVVVQKILVKAKRVFP
jgi:hypothetical protein